MFWDVRLDKLLKKGNKRLDETEVVWQPMHVVHLLSVAGRAAATGPSRDPLYNPTEPCRVLSACLFWLMAAPQCTCLNCSTGLVQAALAFIMRRVSFRHLTLLSIASCMLGRQDHSHAVCCNIQQHLPNRFLCVLHQAMTLRAAASALTPTGWTAATSWRGLWRGSCWRGTSTDHQGMTTQVCVCGGGGQAPCIVFY